MIKIKERRHKRRVRTAFLVYCKPKAQKGFFAISKDLSEEGAKLITEHMVPLNKYFNIEINLIDSLIRLKAKTIWRRQINKEKINLGVRFFPAEKYKGIISSFISNLDN